MNNKAAPTLSTDGARSSTDAFSECLLFAERRRWSGSQRCRDSGMLGGGPANTLENGSRGRAVPRSGRVHVCSQGGFLEEESGLYPRSSGLRQLRFYNQGGGHDHICILEACSGCSVENRWLEFRVGAREPGRRPQPSPGERPTAKYF